MRAVGAAAGDGPGPGTADGQGYSAALTAAAAASGGRDAAVPVKAGTAARFAACPGAARAVPGTGGRGRRMVRAQEAGILERSLSGAPSFCLLWTDSLQHGAVG